MSMELHVLSDQRLPWIDLWQRSIDSEGFALRLSTDASIEALRGYLPALLSEQKCGFECYHDDARDLMDAYGGTVEFARTWEYALSFRWGGNLREAAAAYMAALAYARATNGVIFDPQEGQFLTPDEAQKIARDLEAHAN